MAVPLSQIARLNYEYEEPILWRRNRDLVLTARGDIVDRVQAPDVSKEVAAKLKGIEGALPYGYRIETGGSIEESVKANGALVAVFPVMAIVMLTFLMIQLQSFSRLALVFVTAPLGLIGATGALLIANRPFGFVALLGLIALAGMIMRNTVILSIRSTAISRMATGGIAQSSTPRCGAHGPWCLPLSPRSWA